MTTDTPISALADLKVLDLSTHVAGPYCTKLLGDFGADVIKVEPPAGDPARSVGPFYHNEPHQEGSLLFMYLNTSKRSITLDLTQPDGHALFQKLVLWADLVVESFMPGRLAELGLGYEELEKLNPSMVLLSLSPFGQTGPYSSYKGGDIVEFAMGGFMYTYGEYDRPPLQFGGFQTEYHHGSNAAAACLVALYHQRATGEGQHVDVSSIETQAATIRDTVSQYSYMGAIRRRSPRSDGSAPEERYAAEAKDGYFMGGEALLSGRGRRAASWDEIVEFLGREELRAFASEEVRREKRNELRAIINDAFASRAKYEIVDEAQKRRWSWGPVESPADIVNSPQMAARDYFTTLDHPTTGPIKFPGRPFIMTESPWRVQSRAPLLGEHNAEVYTGMLGYSAQALAQARQIRAI